jgi:hypothetical protein
MAERNLSLQRLTIIILLVGEASGVFAGFCPSWFTVSSPFFHEQDAKEGNVKRIRWGEFAASGIVLATGAAVSYSTKDPVPLVASAVISGIFVGGYEYMIANPSAQETDSDADSLPLVSAWRYQSAK